MVARARASAPEETCGILAGTLADGQRRVEAHHSVENVADRPRSRYEFDPREQLERLEAVEAAGHEVVGFYHSHPRGPAEPSATDAALATWPDRSYVVVSLGDDDEHALAGETPEGASVTAWRWTGRAFEREALGVVDSA